MVSRRYPSTDRLVALIVQFYLQEFCLVSGALAVSGAFGGRAASDSAVPSAFGGRTALDSAVSGAFGGKAASDSAVSGAFGGSAALDSAVLGALGGRRHRIRPLRAHSAVSGTRRKSYNDETSFWNPASSEAPRRNYV